MPITTPAAVRKQIESGSVGPLYLLQGEDDIEKSALGHEFEAIVDEGLRAFNVERIHAGDVSSGDRLVGVVSSLVAAAHTLPMMSPRRLVIVLQADGLLMPKRESEAATRALDAMEMLFKEPDSQTTIVLIAAPLDKRSRMFKLLLKHGALVECGAIETQADAERWIRNRASAAGAQVDPTGARLLAERSGSDIKRLRNDAERLLLYTLGQKTITLDDVRQIVGPATLQDDWAMTNAIEAGDGATALRQLALVLDAGAPPEKVLGQLGWLVRTKFPVIAPGALRPAIEALFRTDLDLKRSGGDPRVLLERLIVELCTWKRGRALGRF
jgi:DNA polymerase III delta subunit